MSKKEMTKMKYHKIKCQILNVKEMKCQKIKCQNLNVKN